MKNLLKFIVIFAFVSINAQQAIYSKKNLPMQENIQTHHNEIRNIFSELNTNNIPTGILVDAAVEFADLSLYNGSLSDNSFTSAKIVKDIYHTLMTGKLSEKLENFITPADFNHTWYEASQEQDIIPIGGIYYRYDKFSNAVSQSFKQNSASRQSFNTPIVGYNAQRNKIIDNGNPQQMYETNEVFALAPSINTFNKLNFQVVFPREIFIVKDYTLIQNIELKIAEGRSFTPISFDKLVEVSYPAEGEYRWTFRITLNNGKQLLSHTKVKIENVLVAGNNSSLSNFANASNGVSSWAYTYKHELDTYKVRKSPFIWSKKIDVPLATIYVRLANGNTQIRKPLIVAEGFDTGHITTPNKEGGDNNIATFLYGNGIQNTKLYNHLINHYDIIYVDWGKGTDYIENNAELLKKAIRWVNENKVGTEKNVVLGQSMGGLVARYALKDMEDKGENHDTKLYISHDTPHLGANIPLGLQYMSRNISQTYLRTPIGAIAEYYVPLFNKGISPNDILTLQDTPAARQMLINYVDKHNRIDNSFHTAWQNVLRDKGYPQLTRNVAISNGSECGSDQKPETLVRLYKETGEHYFINLLDALVGFGNLRFDMMIYSFIPGTSKYIFDFEVNPMLVLNQDKVIYRGKIRYKKKLLWFINSQVTLLEGEGKQPKNIFPLDRYGGGVFKMFKDDLPIFKKDIQIGSFSFIPTPSAIDLYRGTKSLTQEDYTNSYSYNKQKNEVPFSNFVAEKMGLNYTHISFNDRIGDFIINQLSGDSNLQNTVLTSENICGNNVKIGGRTLLCANEKSTYNTGNAERIQWSVVKGGELINNNSSFNQQEFTFTTKDNAQGLVELRADLYESGEHGSVSQKIWVGKPKVKLKVEPHRLGVKLWVESVVDGVSLADQGISIQWKNHTTGETYNGIRYNTPANGNTMERVEATISNNCGSEKFEKWVARTCDNDFLFSLTKTYSDNYTLTYIRPCVEPGFYENAYTTYNQSETFTIQISNAMGQIVLTTKNKEFSLAHLLAGTYYARVIKNGQVVHTQTLLKQ